MTTIKVQTWGDDLRLPCFVNPAETVGLVAEVEHIRRQSVPFQSKHLPALKRNKWFVLRRPADKTRSGLLVLWPVHKCCVYISDRQNPRIALLRLRVDPQMFAEGGMTVFAATLSSSLRRLSIEDTLIWKGRDVLNDEIFSARWALAVQWTEHYCIQDPRLLGGIDIGMAKWESLSRLKHSGVWEIQCDEARSRRLLWVADNGDPKDTSQHSPQQLSPPSPVVPKLETGPLIAVASREAGPEQWTLSSSDGVTLGRALVRTLAVSEGLRSAKTATIRVEVVWNDIFKKWEVKGITDSLASHSANFGSHK